MTDKSIGQVFQKTAKTENISENLQVPEQVLKTPFVLRGSDAEKKELADLVNRIAKSDFGKEILEDASSQGYALRLEDLGGITMGTCRGGVVKEIVVSTRESLDMSVVTLIHEARHAGQIGRGAIDGYNEDYSFKTQMPHKRLMEADAVAASIVVASDLAKKGDAVPLKQTSYNYENMLQSHKDALSMGKSEKEAFTVCALAWYDNTSRKMAYEEDHIMIPMREGYYAMNSRGSFKSYPLQKSVDTICTYKGETYFSEPLSVLKKPERIGVSSYTNGWVERHVKACQKIGADVSSIVSGLPVYQVPEFMVQAKEKRYGKAPTVLSAAGRDEISTAKEYGTIKSVNAVSLAAAQRRAASR